MESSSSYNFDYTNNNNHHQPLQYVPQQLYSYASETPSDAANGALFFTNPNACYQYQEQFNGIRQPPALDHQQQPLIIYRLGTPDNGQQQQQLETLDIGGATENNDEKYNNDDNHNEDDNSSLCSSSTPSSADNVVTTAPVDEYGQQLQQQQQSSSATDPIKRIMKRPLAVKPVKAINIRRNTKPTSNNSNDNNNNKRRKKPQIQIPPEIVRSLTGLDIEKVHNMQLKVTRTHCQKKGKKMTEECKCGSNQLSREATWRQCLQDQLKKIFKRIAPQSRDILAEMLADTSGDISKWKDTHIWMQHQFSPNAVRLGNQRKPNKPYMAHGVECWQPIAFLMLAKRLIPVGPGIEMLEIACDYKKSGRYLEATDHKCVNPYHRKLKPIGIKEVDQQQPEQQQDQRTEQLEIVRQQQKHQNIQILPQQQQIAPFQSLQIQMGSDASIDMLVVDLDKLFREKYGQQQQLQHHPTRIIQLISGGQQFLYAMDNKYSLMDDLNLVAADLQYQFQVPDLSRLISTVDALDEHLLDKTKYVHSCSCGFGFGGNTDVWNNNGRIYHYLFDFLVRLGWIDAIEPREAQFQQIAVCPLGRGKDANSFFYLINSYKLNPFGARMEILRNQLCQPALADPTQCRFCDIKFGRNSAHLMSNLMLQIGIASDAELRAFSSFNCVWSGLPIRARDLLDFFVFSGKFIAFGPQKNLPPNSWQHSRSNEVFIDHTKLNILPTSELPNNWLCFVFCRRRSEIIPTNGNANYFGTKISCYVGLSLFSETSFDHWYFVPKLLYKEWASHSQSLTLDSISRGENSQMIMMNRNRII